jgi:hypothetical protein
MQDQVHLSGRGHEIIQPLDQILLADEWQISSLVKGRKFCGRVMDPALLGVRQGIQEAALSRRYSHHPTRLEIEWDSTTRLMIQQIG